MQVVDMHCDSLYKSVTQNIGLDSDKLEVKLNLNNGDRRLQCYAIWLPDNLSGEEAENLFLKAHKKLNDECKRCQINLLKKAIISELYLRRINIALTLRLKTAVLSTVSLKILINLLKWAYG